MNTHPKNKRTIEVSFTKISEDVIVPTWRNNGGDGFSFKDTRFIWTILGVIWILFFFIFGRDGLPVTALILIAIGLSYYFIMRHPEKWIELNRKDSFISVWTSRRKRKLIGRWHIDLVAIKMNRRWVASSPRCGENRYLIELFDSNPQMTNTPFWKFDNNPKKRGVPFFVLFDLFGDPHPFAEESDYALAFALSNKIETFVRDFLSGKTIAPSSTSTFIFSVPE
jgi:hypothetical protein